MTVSRIKLSLIIAPIALCLVIVIYVYSLWRDDRKKSEDLPVEAVSQMMRDLLRFHDKRGGFPDDLQKLEGVIWEKNKNRLFSVSNRALNHHNYYYFYTRISPHQFTLWSIPTGGLREDAPTWFLVVAPDACRRWKGAALPLEQVEKIEPNPSLKELGSFGLIEQPVIDLKNQQKASTLFFKN
ncbi:MAG: hypothetical protein ACR2F2_11420 [Pyrinomonadaceae bacterium]